MTLRKRRRRPKMLSLFGRLALIVSLWHAPFPMLHAHDADVVHASSASVFMHHMSDFHPDVAVNSHEDFGWHWHLVPPPSNHPEEESSHGNCPFCPQDSHDTLLQTQAPLTVLQSGHWTGPVWMSVPQQPAVGLPVATAPVKFLDTYLDSVPLRTLLRVARC